MKKVVNYLLSFMVIFSFLFNMFSPIIVWANENEIEPKNTNVTMEQIEEKGNLEVEVHMALPIRNRQQNNIEFAIYDDANNKVGIDLNKVNEPEDGVYEQSINIGQQSNVRLVATERDKDGHLLSGVDKEENVVYISVNLYGLNKGKYTIELSGRYFVTYKVDVTLDKFSQRVSLSDEAGMFEIGDVNSDGKVDNTDQSIMLDAIRKNNLSYDLNLDDVIDIADLNYVTAMISNDKGQAKIEPTSAIISNGDVSFDMANVSLAENSGDLSNIFTDEGVVSLQKVEDKPIELGINLSGENQNESVKMSEVRIAVGDKNVPEAINVSVELENGEVITKAAKKIDNNGIHKFTEEAIKGSFVVDLGKQVAVKKVTIIVTESAGNNLADIAKVEFLNNVKVETKEPDNFYTPKNINVDTSVSEQLTVSFDSVPNVTGYEIKVEGEKMASGGTIFQTTFNSFTVEDLKNYSEYTISVQSVNQEWRSGWGSVKATPQATRKPPAVDMVKAVATYSGIDYSWKDMDDTQSYNLYYREVGEQEWIKVQEKITKTSYSLRGLKPTTTYEAYITGNNELGEGAKSRVVEAKTLEAGAAITPKYKLINTTSTTGKTDHISDVIYKNGEMVGGNKFSMVDDDFATYWEVKSIYAGGHYDNINNPITVLDKKYKMDEFVITVPDSFQYSIESGTYDKNSPQLNDTVVYYWTTSNRTLENATKVPGILTSKKDENNRKYYVLKLEKPIEANAIQLGLTNKSNASLIQVSELKFYEYDSLVDDVADLFVDDLRVELKNDVTKEKIEALRQRANTKDNGEYSPYRDSVLADLEYAEKILNDEKLNDVIVLNSKISNFYNDHLKFAMQINDYQPLGIVARPGDTLNVYVGSTGNVNVQLVYTQYHAEANAWSKTYNLKKGQNIVNIEKIGSASDESGGSVYVRYTSKPNEKNPIKVRVSGGTKIPVLDVSLLTSEVDKRAAIKTYIEELGQYNSKLADVYAAEGKTFTPENSVLGSTEIVTKYGLLSFPSVKTLNAINADLETIDEKVERLYESTEAFDEMMELFYRQKGLKVNADDPKDEMPKSRINIRYMRMFDGAFMYAGGFHVGIEYGSITGLLQAHRNSDDATGYFGWGISHEIGHQINQSSTVYAEVTNNVYALLAQTSNDSDKSRLESSGIYEKIYDKVTSHTVGRSQNVFVQLGMYWQLHLYYDKNKTFDDVDSIYARINHESRVYKNDKGYNKDDLLILFASKAANKNLIDFFATWGLVAGEDVTKEINELGLEKETKAIYYMNDKARRYRLNNGKAMAKATKVEANVEETNSKDKRVTLTFNVSQDDEKILGYEILRNGKTIGFVEGDVHTFVDNIGAENNRAYSYSVVAYDYLLNKTVATNLEEVKISHDGSVLKNSFTIESNVKNETEKIDYEADDFDYTKLEVNKLIDSNEKTYFNGTVKYKKLAADGSGLTTDKDSPFVIINLNDKMSVSGIKYKAALENGDLLKNTIKNYRISVSSDKVNWIEAKTGTFDLNFSNGYTNTVYFMKEGTTSESQLWTYDDVAYIKIEAIGNSNGLSGAELDVIAPPGDNIDIEMINETEPKIGKLESDYCYLTSGCEKNPEGVIAKGSVIIQGSYRGSPSFNNILIGDANNEEKVYSGEQYIFAEVNDDMTVYEVAKGTWLYVMTKEQYEKMLDGSKNIRAYLYRVNDANELSGQRLTSTSKMISGLKAYDKLDTVSITSSESE